MNPSLRSAWSAALRSGDYIQGQRELRSPDKRYCAMGVLYDLVATPWEKAQPLWGAFLLFDILKSIGLSNSAQTNIARLNDSGVSFEEIADLIDRDADLETELQVAVDAQLRRIAATAHVEGPVQPLNVVVQHYAFTDKALTIASRLQGAVDKHSCFGLWV